MLVGKLPSPAVRQNLHTKEIVQHLKADIIKYNQGVIDVCSSELFNS